ncbi:MAG TPA: pitrilysin family protein [Bryobacteraceae bacterium]|nr:pitrilysin family protein [Bryobacteraceae bacterium]
MKIESFALAVVLCGTASAADKEPALPKDLPPYGAMKPLAAPRVIQRKLANGLTVWLVPESGFPKVAFALKLRGGYTADPKDRPGFADLLAATVTQGTASRSAKQVAEEIASAGGDLSASAGADSILVDASVLSSRANKAVELLADVAGHAAFADQEVAIAKSNLSASLEADEASPAFLGRRALYRALFGNHPYAVISPTQDSITQTTPADLRREYARRFRPDRALLVAAGDFSESAMESTIERAFGSWKAEGEAAPIESGKPAAVISKAVIVVPRPGSVQTAFYLGTLGPTRPAPDYAAARVANAIYGGMFGSRLVNNIREDKGYTYSPGAAILLNHDAGIVLTRADVRNAVTGASFNEIVYELNRMATTAPGTDEVEHAKRYLLGSLAIQLQSRGAVARQLANLWIDSLPPDALASQAEQIAKVTPAEVQAVARKYFPAWRMTVVAVGDEKVIREELAPFGLEFKNAQ